jgi:hypothetical protein
MSRRINIKLASVSLLVGCLLSFSLLHFLFGTRIYSRSFLFGTCSPSIWLLGVGRAGIDGFIAGALDALIFGVCIYTLLCLYSRLYGGVKYR